MPHEKIRNSNSVISIKRRGSRSPAPTKEGWSWTGQETKKAWRRNLEEALEDGLVGILLWTGGTWKETQGVKRVETLGRDLSERSVGRLTMAAFNLIGILILLLSSQKCLPSSASFLWFLTSGLDYANFWASMTLLWASSTWLGIYSWGDGTLRVSLGNYYLFFSLYAHCRSVLSLCDR